MRGYFCVEKGKGESAVKRRKEASVGAFLAFALLFEM